MQRTLMVMERRAPDGNCGKMWPSRASGGILGRSRRQVWAGVTVLPFGIVTMMVCVAVLLPPFVFTLFGKGLLYG